MSTGMREYRRGLALYVVAHSREPLTAGEVAEAMGTTAMGEGHPSSCWQDLEAPAALGMLRALENAGLVEQTGDTKRDSRSGRTPPTWRYAMGSVAAKRVLLPEPPAPSPAARALAAQAPAPADASPYAGMTRQELYAVLEVSDLYTTACAQFMQQVADLNSRARRILAAAGLADAGEQA